MAVKERNGFVDIRKNLEDLVLLEVFLFLHEFEELAVETRLHDQVDVVVIVEETVQFDDVRVVQVHLDLYLSNERLLDLFFPDQRLRHNLQSTDETSTFVSKLGKTYWAENTFPYLPSPISSIRRKLSRVNVLACSIFWCLKYFIFFEKFIELWFFFYVAR